MRGSVPSGNTIRLGCRCNFSIKLPIKRIAILYRSSAQTATPNTSIARSRQFFAPKIARFVPRAQNFLALSGGQIGGIETIHALVAPIREQLCGFLANYRRPILDFDVPGRGRRETECI